jgi:hypothetical protein
MSWWPSLSRGITNGQTAIFDLAIAIVDRAFTSRNLALLWFEFE